MSTTHTDHRKNQEAVRRRFLLALRELRLGHAVSPDMVNIDGDGFSISDLTVGQLAILANFLEDATTTRVETAEDRPTLVGGLTQPERLPVSFTAARITPQAVLS